VDGRRPRPDADATVQRAKAWHASPADAAILSIRHRHARTNFLIVVEGVCLASLSPTLERSHSLASPDCIARLVSEPEPAGAWFPGRDIHESTREPRISAVDVRVCSRRLWCPLPRFNA